ncbi:MAG: sensor histidine kinase [Actinomycetota bacterium]
MSFRTRLTLVAGVAVAVAVAAASAFVFFIVRGELRGEVDSRLRDLAARVRVITEAEGSFTIELPPPELGGARGFAELVLADRPIPPPPAGLSEFAPIGVIPDTEEDREVARGASGPVFRDENVGGVHVRVLTSPLEQGVAVQLARSLEEADQVLGRLAVGLGLVGALGVVVATALGWLVARTAIAPVRRMTETAEHVSATGDLSHRIETRGGDEVARLAGSFNEMLEALERSLLSQKQLVADASHELRTPLTSLRTNIELLASGKRLPRAERARMLDDSVAQLEDLSLLVGDVVELARNGHAAEDVEEVRLDDIASRAVARARRNSPSTRFQTDLSATVVRAAPARLERAVNNLLDNAVKWGPPRGPVEVTVAEGRLTVRDHGPGIAEEDLPHVFDRFYRSADARGLPGSGLGLAIVKQVADAHGATLTAENAEGGGGRFTLDLSPPS